MKILFICGSLEPGRDGVGDYIRRLSLEIIRHGHQVALTAINDRHVQEVQKDTIESVYGKISIFRLPEIVREESKIPLLEKWITEQDPDWLSLQFVPFSFHRRGLIFGLAGKLKSLGKGRKWHIMFHELWVGMDQESGQKQRAWGIVQRYLNKNLIKVLGPVIIHTHTGIYKKQLEKLGATVQLLPLFSNIPVSYAADVQEKINTDYSYKNEADLVIFGGIHTGAPIQQLAQDAADYARSKDVVIRLVIIGKSGMEQQRWINEWTAVGLPTLPLGEQTEENVSRLLSKATYGIFTTPIALVEKSGSVAAMREHGVQLICVSREWSPRNMIVEENPFGIQEYKKGNLEAFFKSKADFSCLPTLPKIAEQFITNLKVI